MTDKCLFHAYLDSIFLPYKVRLFIAENFDEKELISNINKFKKEICNNLGESVYLKLKNAISAENIENYALEFKKYGINAVFYMDKDYPLSLQNIQDFPIVLYYRGDLSILNENIVAIIGTRKPTFYGREVTRFFARELCFAGVVTASGLAYGLDSEVAVASLEAKGKTIVVLGGGLDKIYPSQNQNLSDKIAVSGGLLLSEYPLFHRPTKFSFIQRNRIISGISKGVIIVEAGRKSGTLNTARHAIEQGKEIFAIPGNIFSSASVGTNELILELPEIFTVSPSQVLEKLHIAPKNVIKDEKQQEIMSDEKCIVKALYEGDMDFDTLQMKTQIDSKSLISLLTRMEISGLIKKLPGNFYSL